MDRDPSRLRNGRGKRTPFGREWRVEPRAELLAATICLPQFEGPEHRHPEAQVAILLSGSSATFSCEGISGSVHSPIAPGSFAYIPPGELHRTQWHGWTELLNLYWDGDFLPELADQNGCSFNKEPVPYRFDPAIQSIGRILIDEFLLTGALSPMMIDHGRALAASRLFRIIEQRSRNPRAGLLPQGRIQNAVDAMIANPERSFTLIELARLCHSSVFHFSRSFTAHEGCAPFAFQRTLRVQKAKELLLGTELSIEAISQTVGIESPTSFSRMFRSLAGQSPRQYRQSNSAHARAERGNGF